MIRLKEQVKAWMGPLWWHSAVLFLVFRLSDVINALIGLWLVPKYVPQEELGAVLPLTQVGSVLGLPLTILLVPFTKFLNTYATRGEYGKVKRILRDAFLFSILLLVFTLLYAQFVMPLIFERMRVAKGSLGFLIVISGILATVSPVFVTALQALKRFNAISMLNVMAAPIRLATLLIAMPIRAISGYFVGQTTPSIFLIFFALFNLRKQLGQEVKAEAYWKSDRYPILKYAFPVAVFVSVGTLQTLVETFVIRHRLPSLDSAGYYVISRFAEIGGYVGLTLVFVLFPLAAESHEKGGRSCRMLWHSIVGAFVSGVLLSSLLWARGEWLLSVIPTWQEYAVYNSQMAVLAMVFTLRSVGACFVNFEMACGRFGFVCYFAGIAGLESVLLYGLTGYSFFEERVPSFWITWAERLNACRLDFVIQVMFVSSCLTAVCALLHEVMRHLPRRVTVPHVDVKFE